MQKPTRPSISSMLLASADPERLHAWYADAFDPSEDEKMDQYRVLRFGEFHLLIDSRDDVGGRNPEPGRMIPTFEVPDARAVAARLEELETTWLARLEDREGSLFATAIDPDGNYVQFVQLSDAHRAEMER